MMIRQGNRNGYYLLYLFMTGLFLGILLVNIRHDIWISEDGLLNTAMIRQLQNSEFDGNYLFGYIVRNRISTILVISMLASTIIGLPIVSEADANGNQNAVAKAIWKSIQYCLLLGFLCTAIFLLFGRFAGRLLFNSELAGSFILTLSFICPFMYIASTLNSILNGLGKTALTFLYSILSLLVRLLFVFYAIPVYGIKGYLWGMLASQMVQTLLCTFSALRVCKKTRNACGSSSNIL